MLQGMNTTGRIVRNGGWMACVAIGVAAAPLWAQGTPPSCGFRDPNYIWAGATGDVSAVDVGDLDGDGDLDLVVPKNGSPDPDSVQLILNNGDGTFTVGSSVVTGNGARDAKLVDLDGDGDLDLLTANFFENDITTNMNLGGGVFGAATSIGFYSGPTRLTVADFDGDGDIDFAVTLNNVNRVRFRLNDGSGGFPSGNVQPINPNPEGIASGDLDGDGDIDVAATSRDTDTVSLFFNDGSGVFGAAVPIAVGVAPVSVAIGDLDNDGDNDIVTANWGTLSQLGNTISVLLNDGAASFTPATPVIVKARPSTVALEDVNSDGVLDVVSGDEFDEGYSLAFGVGDGTFQPTRFFDVFDRPVDVAVADVNMDGAPDLIGANNLFDFISVLKTDCGITLPPPNAQILWQTFADIGGVDQAGDFAARDSAGNSFIAGNSTSGFDVDFWATSFDPTGAIRWQTTVDGGANGFDDAKDIAAAPDGDLVLAGAMQFPAGSNWGVTRLDGASGAVQWISSIPDGSFVGASAVTVDASNNTIVVGPASTGSAFPAAIAKFDPNGLMLWEQHYPASGDGAFNDVLTDAAGNIYVTGSADPPSGIGSELVVVKYDPAGVIQWEVRVDATNDSGNVTFGTALIMDAAGSIYAAGTTFTSSLGGGGTGNDMLTVKVDASGNLRWSQVFIDDGSTRAFAIAQDSAGNLFVSGQNGLQQRLVTYSSAGVERGWNFVNATMNEDNTRQH
ncbi:MAG: hypothetical protein D6744_08590, partial [Planctomycetota bacterium]